MQQPGVPPPNLGSAMFVASAISVFNRIVVSALISAVLLQYKIW